MKKVLIVFLAVLTVSLSLAADVYIKTKTHTDPMTMMGQTTPAKDEIQEMWLSEGRMAQVTAGQTMLIDMGKKKMFWINHGSKSYVETALPPDISKLLPPEMAAMAGMMKATATVTPNNDKKKIGSWNCVGYTMNMSMMGMSMPMKVWASTEVPFDYAKYSGLMAEMFKAQMRLDDASVKEYAKIKGYQIATEMNMEMMGAKIHSTTETLEISQKAAPASVWAVPAGYAKRDTLTMEEMNKR